MKNTKTIATPKILLKILYSIFAVLALISISVFCYLLFDEQAKCLDLGKIYDPEQKICRDDCLTWDEKIGCVPITEENIRKKEKGLPFNK